MPEDGPRTLAITTKGLRRTYGNQIKRAAEDSSVRRLKEELLYIVVSIH